MRRAWIRYEGYVVLVLLCAYVLSFVDRQIISLMVDPIRRSLGIGDTQFSLLHGVAFTLFYVVAGVPVARLADRYARKYIIAVIIAVWSLATTACGLSASFVQLFVARAFVGLGEGGLSPTVYSMLADYFPKERLGRAIATYSMGSFIGGGLAMYFGGTLLQYFEHVAPLHLPWAGSLQPWQVVFMTVGLPGLIVAALVLATVQEPARCTVPTEAGRAPAGAAPAMPPSKGLCDFLYSHRCLLLRHVAGFSLLAITLNAVLFWSPSYYMREHGMEPGQIGLVMGTILLICCSTGTFLGGWLTDYLYKRGLRESPLLVGLFASLGTLPAVAGMTLGGTTASLVFLALILFSGSTALAPSATLLQVICPPHQRAQVTAVFLMLNTIVGLVLGSTLAPLISDFVFADESSLGTSMLIVCAAASAGAAVALQSGCRILRDPGANRTAPHDGRPSRSGLDGSSDELI